MKTYNIYIVTDMKTYNILNIGKNDLQIVMDAYHKGKSDFFIAGKKYWLKNLFEIKIFEFDQPERFETFITRAKQKYWYKKGIAKTQYLSPSVLKQGGKEVTRDFIKGEYREKANNENTRYLKTIGSMDIFISHSSKDVEIVEALVNIIIKAFKLPNSKIRCTSLPGFKLFSGATTDKELREEIFASKVFIGIITTHSIDSTYVLFELGARWGSKKPLFPLVCDPLGISLLKAPLNNLNALSATNTTDIHKFIEDFSKLLDKQHENPSAYIKEIEILKNLSTKEVDRSAPKSESSRRSSEEDGNAHKIIIEQSKKEYPSDYRMQEYFIEEQRKALKELKKDKPDDISDDIFRGINNKAKNQWPNNFVMRLYTVRQQIESYRKLNNP